MSVTAAFQAAVSLPFSPSCRSAETPMSTFELIMLTKSINCLTVQSFSPGRRTAVEVPKQPAKKRRREKGGAGVPLG